MDILMNGQLTQLILELHNINVNLANINTNLAGIKSELQAIKEFEQEDIKVY